MVYGTHAVKHKSRNLPTIYSLAAYDTVWNSNGTIYEQNAVAPFVVSEGHEEISYSTKPKSLRSMSNFCRHIKSSRVLPAGNTPKGGSALALNPDGTFLFNSIDGQANIASQIAWTAFNSALPPHGEGTVLGLGAQGYINDAFAAVKPDLTSISIPNFLLELDDLPRMFQLWKKKVSVARNIAGLRLNWAFGWKPFIGDLETIRGVIASVYKRCKEWNDKAGELFHRSKTFPVFDSTVSGNFVYPSGLHKAFWRGSGRGTATAHLVFRTGKIPELDTMEGVLRAYLDFLGIELNPRIIWDAIPFSFVADWFFGIGNWLQTFKRDTLELPITLVDSYLQYKEELRCETYWQRGSDGTYLPQPRSGSYHQDEYFFGRLPIFPDLSAATTAGWRIPGTNQLTNLFSLATALSGK